MYKSILAVFVPSFILLFASLSISNNIIPYRKGDKWGYVDAKMIVKIPIKYDKVYPFDKGLAVFHKGNKSGLLNTCGNVVCVHKYDTSILDVMKKDINVTYQRAMRVDRLNENLLKISDADVIDANDTQEVNWNFLKNYFKVGYYGTDKCNNNTQLKYRDTFINNWTPNVYNRYIVESTHNKYGFIDETGKEIIPAIYDSVGLFIDGFALVRSNGKYGFIDVNGTTAVPLDYNEVKSFHKGIAVLKKDNMWKVINTTFELICEFKDADEINVINELFLSVTIGDRKKLINHKSQFISEKNYQFISLNYDKYISCFSNDYGEDLYDLNGNFVVYCEKNMARNITNSNMFIFRSSKHGSVGVMNIKGDTIIPNTYDDIQDAYNNVFVVQRNTNNETISGGKKSNKYALFSYSGKQITEFKYDYLKSQDSGHYFIAQLNNKIGMINDDGHIVCDFKYDYVSKHGVIKSIYNNNNCDIYNLKGKLIFSYIDDEPNNIHTGNFGAYIVNSKGKKGAIDNNSGKILLELEYNDVHIVDSSHAVINRAGKASLINFRNKSPNGDWYDYIDLSITNFNNFKYFPVKDNGKYGFIDLNGRLVIACKYDKIAFFHNGYAYVIKNGVDFFIDENGKEYYE